MAKLSFKLREVSENSTSIQLYFNYGLNKRFRYSTGLFIQNAKNWDVKKMRIKNVASELDRHIINEKLDDLQSKLNKAYKTLTIEENKEASNDFFINFCDTYFNKKDNTVKAVPELLPFYLWYIENYKNKPLTTTGKPLAKTTIKTYNSAYEILLKYEKAGNNVSYKAIDFDFYNNFISWLQKEDYSTNYIGNQIKTLKTMLNASSELSYHSNLESLKKYFKKPKENVESIYLNIDELDKIIKCDFTNTEPIIVNKTLKLTPDILDRARDLFIISSYTALRVSDFVRLNSKNIIVDDKGKKFIQITTQKNNKRLTIPINSIVNTILEKRDGSFPKRLQNQHINYALKEIGRIAEIDENITQTKTKGGNTFQISVKKYKLITNHCGRKNFCTNAYLAGMRTFDIMAISGHSSEKVFYDYIKVSGLEKAQKTGEHPFLL